MYLNDFDYEVAKALSKKSARELKDYIELAHMGLQPSRYTSAQYIAIVERARQIQNERYELRNCYGVRGLVRPSIG